MRSKVMSSIDRIVKFNAQTAGREKLIRLCQFITKFVNSSLRLYYVKYAKGGRSLLEFIYKLRELEQYFISCRRLLNFGQCTDQFYSALRSMQIIDPVTRTTLTISKLGKSFALFSDHVLWLNQMGFLEVEKSIWVERANRFWVYSISMNLLRDFYELICVIQREATLTKGNLESRLVNFSISTPIKWIRTYPKLSCDFIKNFCDFWIPYSAMHKLEIHPAIISILGIISTSLSIIQIYDKDYRFSPS